MRSKKQIIKALESVSLRLKSLRIDIERYNREGKQFDYVSDPRLSNAVDNMFRHAKGIEKIVNPPDEE